MASWPESHTLIAGSGLHFCPGTVHRDAAASVQPQGEMDQLMSKAENELIKHYTAAEWHSGVAWSQLTVCCIIAAANTGMMVGNHSWGSGEGQDCPHQPQHGHRSAGWMGNLAWGASHPTFPGSLRKETQCTFVCNTCKKCPQKWKCKNLQQCLFGWRNPD